MTASATEAGLAQVYRRSQLALRATTIRDTMRLWPALNLENPGASYPAWLAAMRTLVERDRGVSRSSTTAYLTTAWTAAGLTGTPDIPAVEIPAEQVETSLRVTSLVAYRRGLGLGLGRSEAASNALVQVSGAASRLVLDAGRQTVLGTAASNNARWTRTASGGACAFCKMLAGRGAVYRSDTSAGFDAHDHCGCTASVLFDARAA